MAKLQFGAATKPVGFTPLETASFNELPPARIVRELVQNSVDAAVEAGESVAIVRFQVDPVGLDEIPDLAGYCRSFERAVKHWTGHNNGSLSDPSQEVVDRIEAGVQAIRSGRARVLSILDNGVGLDEKRMNALMSDGAGEKPYDLSGSYGVGHLAPMGLSNIRYMLYGGLTADGNRIACGRTILASHPGKRVLMSAEGYLIKQFKNGLDGNLYEFLGTREHPPLVKRCIDEIKTAWGHGCAVLIPAFNNFGSEGMALWDIVSKVAAYNFSPAIYQGKLVIEVCEADHKRTVDQDSLSSILESEATRIRSARRDTFFAGLRPSGQNAYSVLQTLSQGARESVSANGNTAHVTLLVPPLNGQHRVDLFRNGMWITDSVPELHRADFANIQPFHAVIEIEGRKDDHGKDSELHRLVRKAEGPMHDQLSLSRLSNIEEENLCAILRRISESIKQTVPPIGTDVYTVDDYLLVNTGNIDGTGGGRRSFSFWGIPTPMARRSPSQIAIGNEPTRVDPNPDPRPKSRPRPKPHQPRIRQSSPLPFQSVVVPWGTGRLNGSISSESSFPEVLITLRVDENADATCDRIWHDEDVSFKTLAIKPEGGSGKAPDCAISQDKRSVKVTGLDAMVSYKVQVEYEVSQELAASVGAPVLRLEMHRPANPKLPQS